MAGGTALGGAALGAVHAVGVVRAGVPDEDDAVLDVVAAHAVGVALVDAVYVVDAPADCVLFDDAETHCWWNVGGLTR